MHHLKYVQKLPLTLDECWNFFSSPGNLKLITPQYLGFELSEADPSAKMYPGQIVTHKISPLRFVTYNWVTEITHVKELDYFIDEQRFGPYKFWHHEHRFRPISGGVEMTDLVHYIMPFGFIGHYLHQFFVRKDLEQIFQYRKQRLEEIFGKYEL